MNFTSEKQRHPLWVFPTAIAFGLSLAAFMGAPMGRQVGKAFSLCGKRNNP